MLYLIINLIVLGISIFIILKGLDHNKYKETNTNLPYLLPSEINYLYKDMTYMNRAILSTLLDLKRRGKIEVIEYDRESRNKTLEDYVTEYEFRLLDFSGLKDHELLFLDNIFQDKEVVTTDELTQRAIDGDEFLRVQGKWVNAIEEELKTMGLISLKNKKASRRLSLLGLFYVGIGTFSLINQEISGLISLIAAMPVLLISVNLKIDKSQEGRNLLNAYSQLEKRAKAFELENLSEEDLIELLALCITMKYFIPAYEKSQNFESIDLVVKSINEYDGSKFDDGILRGFMGYTAKTRDDTLDTNRIDYRLFK